MYLRMVKLTEKPQLEIINFRWKTEDIFTPFALKRVLGYRWESGLTF